jgi:FkbM family methyltransferase
MSIRELADSFKRGAIDKPDYIRRMHEEHARLFEYAAFLQDTNVREIRLSDGDVIMVTRSSGLQFYVDQRDLRSIPVEMLNFGDHEPEEVGLCLDALDSMRCLLDVGGNVGWFSLECAARHPELAIHAFEPLPVTYAQLTRNLALNDARTVTPHNFGFSDQAGPVTFYYYPEGLGNTSMQNLSERESVVPAQCEVRLLDDFVRENDLRVDCIKCDVVGAELMVLKGGLATLREHRPVLFLELLRKWAAKFGYHPREVAALLAELGYECFVPHVGRLAPLSGPEAMDVTEATNFFFLHRDKHAALRDRLV